MSSEDEFEVISKVFESILGSKDSNQIAIEEEQKVKDSNQIAIEEVQKVREIEKRLSSILREKHLSEPPVANIEGYFVPKGTEILISKLASASKNVLSEFDFHTIVTTKDVKYDVEDLVFDRTQNLIEISSLGMWAELYLGFRLPRNDKHVQYFLVLRHRVDILRDAGYNDRMKDWVKKVIQTTGITSKVMDEKRFFEYDA